MIFAKKNSKASFALIGTITHPDFYWIINFCPYRDEKYFLQKRLLATPIIVMMHPQLQNTRIVCFFQDNFANKRTHMSEILFTKTGQVQLFKGGIGNQTQ